ncbi:alpha/beta fold hydrolase [Alkalilacustris brevis]|uniref:alpha/beta fold hydrolase n=1 Tax=Alkalilacustris brevis TaxID=2026338 RepID=UPI000E0DD473|nr:alpha/beta fold hydrolase [Alkalilacustris brevis]
MTPHYRISGPEGGAPLVLSHGLATNLHMWEPALPALEQEFRVIRYDARGHGATPSKGTVCTLHDLQSDVIALLDHLNIERAHFAGLSMVGMGLGLDHADRLLSLVVCDARADAPEAYRSSWDDRIARIEAGGLDALVEPTLERWFTEAFKSDNQNMDWMRAMMRTTRTEGFICCARALQGLDYLRRLSEMRVPTLYLVGDQDAGAPPDVMRKMHCLTPGSKFVMIEDAGHISAVEQPATVAAEITRFIRARQDRSG